MGDGRGDIYFDYGLDCVVCHKGEVEQALFFLELNQFLRTSLSSFATIFFLILRLPCCYLKQTGGFYPQNKNEPDEH